MKRASATAFPAREKLSGIGYMARSLCSTGAFLCFFVSVRYLPLADAVAVAFGGPFIVTALSVPLLGERRVGRRFSQLAT